MTEDIAMPSETADEELPLYLQVASTLRTAILRGIYPVASRIPTEEELCRRFNVSRHTIREALRQLRGDGLIASRPGSRPTVAAPPLPGASEFFADEGGFDYMIGTRLAVEGADSITIGDELAREIDLPAGERWLCVKGYRVNADDGRATCWNEYYVKEEHGLVARLLPRHVGPVLPLLEDLFSLRATRITRSISAIPLPARQARTFNAKTGCAALKILTRCEAIDGGTILLNRSIHLDGTFSYSIRR
jgi:DNA-binding GntR family transcriptional regulator